MVCPAGVIELISTILILRFAGWPLECTRFIGICAHRISQPLTLVMEVLPLSLSRQPQRPNPKPKNKKAVVVPQKRPTNKCSLRIVIKKVKTWWANFRPLLKKQLRSLMNRPNTVVGPRNSTFNVMARQWLKWQSRPSTCKMEALRLLNLQLCVLLHDHTVNY